jgi:hypothetical protein
MEDGRELREILEQLLEAVGDIVSSPESAIRIHATEKNLWQILTRNPGKVRYFAGHDSSGDEIEVYSGKLNPRKSKRIIIAPVRNPHRYVFKKDGAVYDFEDRGMGDRVDRPRADNYQPVLPARIHGLLTMFRNNNIKAP